MNYPAPKLLYFLTLSDNDVWKFQLSSVVLGMLISFRSCFFFLIISIIFIFSCYWEKIKYPTVCYFPNQWFSKIVPLFWNKEFFFHFDAILSMFYTMSCILTLDLSNVLVVELQSQLQIELLSFDCRLYLNEETRECAILIMLKAHAPYLMVTSKCLRCIPAEIH